MRFDITTDNQGETMSKTIEIEAKEYKRLLKADYKLTLLENGGVDNWDWYVDALYPDDAEQGDENYEQYCDRLDVEYPDTTENQPTKPRE